MTAAAAERDVLRAGLGTLAGELAAGDAPWLADLRRAALARFEERGFPTTRDEAWRKTSVAPIAGAAFRPAAPAEFDRGRASALLRHHGPGPLHYVFVNGRHVPELSGDRAVPGLAVRSLRELRQQEPQRLEAHLGRALAERGHAFTDLNAALFQDGAAVLIAPDAVLPEPVHLSYLSANPGGPSTASFPRTVVLAGRGSAATLVETYGGYGEYLTAAATEVLVEDGASVEHYRLQREDDAAFHVGALAVHQGRDARYAYHSFDLGAALSRHDVDTRFDGEGGECALRGLFLVDGARHADVHTRVDHAVPHCTSRQLFRGVVDGAARGVFDGTIVVRKGAQKTDAWQTSKNLLLSRRALVDSTPRLEILADDVKCKHGSTTGQLDPEAVFYLRSRGLDEAAARALLTTAFALDVVEGVRVPSLRAVLDEHLRVRLGGTNA
jgi:Fe-S cluster assembly protein SufD